MTEFFRTGKKMRIIPLFLICIFSFSLSQCVSYDFARRVTQQGNLLSAKRIKRLQRGMTKEEVAILMGTSLISPTFDNDRWDYAYTLRRGNGPLLIRHLSLFFVDGALARIVHQPFRARQRGVVHHGLRRS